jgi:flagellar biogenesis protein FliO
MSIYLNAALMLGATLGAILLLARLLQSLRAGHGLRGLTRSQAPLAARRISIEETCPVDAKRRLLLVRCEEQRILILTGGPTDLVVATLPPIASVSTGSPVRGVPA